MIFCSSTVNAAKTLLMAVPAGALCVVVGWWILQRTFSQTSRSEQPVITTSEPATPTKYPVLVHPGPETPQVVAMLGGEASPALISCSTCHATRPPDLSTVSATQLVDFHQGLYYAHGSLSCLSCHNADNYDTLRKADGSAVEYPQTVQLCAQCHGPQYRDYTHYSHGGMTGHWDLTSGPRERNTCTDCHDPHQPAYPRVQPVFPPQDRGARQQRERLAHVQPKVSHE